MRLSNSWDGQQIASSACIIMQFKELCEIPNDPTLDEPEWVSAFAGSACFTSEGNLIIPAVGSSVCRILVPLCSFPSGSARLCIVWVSPSGAVSSRSVVCHSFAEDQQLQSWHFRLEWDAPSLHNLSASKIFLDLYISRGCWKLEWDAWLEMCTYVKSRGRKEIASGNTYHWRATKTFFPIGNRGYCRTCSRLIICQMIYLLCAGLKFAICRSISKSFQASYWQTFFDACLVDSNDSSYVFFPCAARLGGKHEAAYKSSPDWRSHCCRLLFGGHCLHP